MRIARAFPRLLAPALLAFCCGLSAQSAAQTAESSLAAAVTDCRRHQRTTWSATSIHLSDDHSVLCFDGQLTKELDISRVHELIDGGLFVIRSPGGYVSVATKIANILKSKAATIVVYDYCISACADDIYASVDTYVVRNSVVAWHNGTYEGSDAAVLELLKKHAAATQSSIVKKMILMLNAGGQQVDRLWMWHPRYYANVRKTKITYESYPESQDEVDDITRKLGLPHIIRDP
jgi:hypothetical protein